MFDLLLQTREIGIDDLFKVLVFLLIFVLPAIGGWLKHRSGGQTDDVEVIDENVPAPHPPAAQATPPPAPLHRAQGSSAAGRRPAPSAEPRQALQPTVIRRDELPAPRGRKPERPSMPGSMRPTPVTGRRGQTQPTPSPAPGRPAPGRSGTSKRPPLESRHLDPHPGHPAGTVESRRLTSHQGRPSRPQIESPVSEELEEIQAPEAAPAADAVRPGPAAPILPQVRGELRRAVVFAEILGPPLALRDPGHRA